MARYFCRLFSLAHLFLFGKNISQTQDINPELGTLGHILVTAIIFSVAAVRKNNAANGKRKLIAAVILFFVSAANNNWPNIFAEEKQAQKQENKLGKNISQNHQS